jgi:hypothetical protein
MRELQSNELKEMKAEKKEIPKWLEVMKSEDEIECERGKGLS